MMHRQPTEPRNTSAVEGLASAPPCADSGGRTPATEPGRLGRSSSFGSLGGLINFVSRLGKDDIDCQSTDERKGKAAPPCKKASVAASAADDVDDSDSSSSDSSDADENKYRELRRRERLESGVGTAALPLSFLFRSTRPAAPARQNSTPNVLSSELMQTAADDGATATSRRESLFKHNSDSHLHAMIADDDIDYVVSLKLLLAEAKSKADVTGMQCAELMKKNTYLEHRLVGASSRIAELESELQLHTTFTRRMSNSKRKIARLEETNRTLQRQLTDSRLNPAATANTSSASSRAAPDIEADLELSIMRRRVQDLERQNRMLRSELVGAGRELDEHRQQSSSSLNVAELHLPDDESGDESEERPEVEASAEAEAEAISAQDVQDENSGDDDNGENDDNNLIQSPEDILNMDDEGETSHRSAQEDTGHEGRRRCRRNMSSASSTEMHIFAFGSMSSSTTATTVTEPHMIPRRSSLAQQQQQQGRIPSPQLPLH